MSLDRELWRAIEPLARRHGVEIFDIEAPKSSSGAMRVFIHRPKSSGEGQDAGVNISDCAALSREILELENIETLLPGDMTLEVSSPGVNRKLRRAEHFSQAVGERVKIKYSREEGGREVAIGILSAFDGETLTLNDETQKRTVIIPAALVAEARVDFVFE
ncbi:MAG: ribosome maturation factor RimP [Deltaproteobacteria bacterium]|nr:ribosome maturation factor RimP [Deltaproteobacteria bacterium]